MRTSTPAEGNRLIAEFMGGKIEKRRKVETVMNESMDSPFVCERITSLKYHSSWDWQIPVWSKLALEVKTYLENAAPITSKLVNENFDFNACKSRYEEAVFQNQPEKGHEVIMQLLLWYNTIQKQK